MANVPTAALQLGVAAAAILLFAVVWFATNGFSRWARIAVRLLALLGIVAGALYFSLGVPPQREMAEEITAQRKMVEEERRAKADDEYRRLDTKRMADGDARAKGEAERQRLAALERELAEASRKTDEDFRTKLEAEHQRRAALERELLEARRRADEQGAKRAEPPPPPPATAAPSAQPAPMAPRGPAAPEPKAAERPADDLSAKGGPAPGVPAAPEGDWDVVPVFYGTDRARKNDPKGGFVYNSERARRLELGRALVTVPKVHQVPKIERPFALRVPYFQVTIYEQAEDPKLHFTIRELKALSEAEFLALARERVGGSTSFKDQAVVFVHGYNTGFDFALYRTAQMAYDLKFDGAAFLYSWPSGGGVMGYGYDRESATQAEPHLKEFLGLVLKQTGAKSVSVIAHSMGNLPLLNVLRELGPTLPPDVRLNEIIMAAPDVDRDVFQYLASNIKAYGRGVTLYCSANDRAMAASRRVAGGVPRAGDVPAEGPIVLDGIDTIDVTQASTDVLALNHSTYAERSALLNDIGLLLRTGERPPELRIPILQKVGTPTGFFWRYPGP